METNPECEVVVRYRPSQPQEWPWSLTYERDQPVLTITDMDDSSLGIALRAIAQAGRAASDYAATPPPNEGDGAERFASTRS